MSRHPTNLQASNLADVAPGAFLRIVAVDEELLSALGPHGIRPGAMVHVEGDAPFRGPRIVRCGAARVAIDRRVARRIQVRDGGQPGEGTA